MEQLWRGATPLAQGRTHATLMSCRNASISARVSAPRSIHSYDHVRPCPHVPVVRRSQISAVFERMEIWTAWAGPVFVRACAPLLRANSCYITSPSRYPRVDQTRVRVDYLLSIKICLSHFICGNFGVMDTLAANYTLPTYY